MNVYFTTDNPYVKYKGINPFVLNIPNLKLTEEDIKKTIPIIEKYIEDFINLFNLNFIKDVSKIPEFERRIFSLNKNILLSIEKSNFRMFNRTRITSQIIKAINQENKDLITDNHYFFFRESLYDLYMRCRININNDSLDRICHSVIRELYRSSLPLEETERLNKKIIINEYINLHMENPYIYLLWFIREYLTKTKQKKT